MVKEAGPKEAWSIVICLEKDVMLLHTDEVMQGQRGCLERGAQSVEVECGEAKGSSLPPPHLIAGRLRTGKRWSRARARAPEPHCESLAARAANSRRLALVF